MRKFQYELTVSGLIDLRSWCFAAVSSGSECGRLKSPMRFACSSDVDSAWCITASELQRTRRRAPDILPSCEQLSSTHSLARFTNCLEDVGVSCPTKHVGDVSVCASEWAVKFSWSPLSVAPRRRLRPSMAAALGFVTERPASSSESLNSVKPSSTSGTGDSHTDWTARHLVCSELQLSDLCMAFSWLCNSHTSTNSNKPNVSIKLNTSTFVFYPHNTIHCISTYTTVHYHSNAMALCLSVSLSQVGVLSKWLNKLKWFLAQKLLLTYHTVTFL